jgi:hypothetical protein
VIRSSATPWFPIVVGECIAPALGYAKLSIVYRRVFVDTDFAGRLSSALRLSAELSSRDVAPDCGAFTPTPLDLQPSHHYVRLDLFGDDVPWLARHGSGAEQQSGEPV